MNINRNILMFSSWTCSCSRSGSAHAHAHVMFIFMFKLMISMFMIFMIVFMYMLVFTLSSCSVHVHFYVHVDVDVHVHFHVYVTVMLMSIFKFMFMFMTCSFSWSRIWILIPAKDVEKCHISGQDSQTLGQYNEGRTVRTRQPQHNKKTGQHGTEKKNMNHNTRHGHGHRHTKNITFRYRTIRHYNQNSWDKKAVAWQKDRTAVVQDNRGRKAMAGRSGWTARRGQLGQNSYTAYNTIFDNFEIALRQ